MTRYVALLRAVNVGGTGKLLMTELVRICRDAGFLGVRTYIASGNAVFTTGLPEATVKAALQERLAARAGQPVAVLVRSANEMANVLLHNPFRDDPPDRVVAIFLDDSPGSSAMRDVRGQKNERLALGTREIYVAYGDGMARSKLRIPAADAGTARNMSTVAKLAALAREG